MLALLNPWQRDFPLLPEPFAHIAALGGRTTAEVLHGFARAQATGMLSRIGGVFAPGAGGAALLCAMAVPTERLDAVADIVSAHPGVNHNYEREDAFNLWFVLTGADDDAVEAALQALEDRCGLPALRLKMQRAYRIDLGFDLARDTPAAMPAHRPCARALRDDERPLAALVEDGLPLVERPYDAWAQALGIGADAVIARLRDWQAQGVLKRFGAVVRHHEFGFAANAMTVLDLPDEAVDTAGAALAAEPGVTLAYRRTRASGWPFNLYCMVHGRDRATVLALIDAALRRCGLHTVPRRVLFSRRRFKQTGARRFRDLPLPAHVPAEACDA